MLRAVIDPHTTPLRAPPREERDLVIAATNAWAVVFDNLSSLPDWLSDALSRLATGTGFGTRELYTDDDEKLFSAARPIILNGIEEVITQPDLMDRAILIHLPSIKPAARRSEKVLRADFETIWPAVLGALCTAVTSALRPAEDVALAELPRMADFAVWVAAAAPALGWSATRFLEAYEANRRLAHETALDASLVAGPLRALLAENGGRWDGLLKDLLQALSGQVGEEIRRQKGWPKTSRGLSGTLARLAPVLREVGITYRLGRQPKTNLAMITFPSG
jgi:hypothetical protein